MKNSFDKFLYDSLPPIYRSEDLKIKPNPEPLKRFLQILHEGGFKPLIESAENIRNLSDVDNARPEDLNLIVKQLGLDFPYNMSEAERKKYIKIIPSLYKLKGVEDSFNYLAREIFSTKSKIDTRVAEYVEGMTPEEWRKIFLNIEIDGGLPDIQRKEENFRKFVEIIRPVNRILVINLMLMYYTAYDLQGRARDSSFETLKDHQGVDRFRYRLLVDGVDQNTRNSGIILGQNPNEFLCLNQGKIYGNQKLKELIKILDDSKVLDSIILSPDKEVFNFGERVSDFFDNFFINATNLNRFSARLGYNSHRDVIILNEGVSSYKGYAHDNYDSTLMSNLDSDIFSNKVISSDAVVSSTLNLTKPITRLNKGMKLNSSFYLTHFTPLQTNFSY